MGVTACGGQVAGLPSNAAFGDTGSNRLCNCAASVCGTAVLDTMNRSTNMFCNCRASNMCTSSTSIPATGNRPLSARSRGANVGAPFATNSMGFVSRGNSGAVGSGSHIVVNGPGPSLCKGFADGLVCGGFSLDTALDCSCNGSICGCRHSLLRDNDDFCGRAATITGH